MRKLEHMKKFEEQYWKWIYRRSETVLIGIIIAAILISISVGVVSYVYATGSVRVTGITVAVFFIIAAVYHPYYLMRDMHSASYQRQQLH